MILYPKQNEENFVYFLQHLKKMIFYTILQMAVQSYIFD